MTDQCIVLLDADGGLAGQVFVPIGETAASTGSNPLGMREIPVSRVGDLMTEKFDADTATWSTDLDELRGALLAQVDAEREAHRGAVMTRLQGQDYAYGEKANEVRDYRYGIDGDLTGLTADELRARFPFAAAEATMTGDTPGVVLCRFEAGALVSREEIARVEGLAVIAKRAIRAATTEAAVRAAANVTWKTMTS